MRTLFNAVSATARIILYSALSVFAAHFALMGFYALFNAGQVLIFPVQTLLAALLVGALALIVFASRELPVEHGALRLVQDLAVALIVGILGAGALFNARAAFDEGVIVRWFSRTTLASTALAGAALGFVGRRYLHGHPGWSQLGWRIIRSLLLGTAAGLGFTAFMGHIVLPLFLGLSSAPSMLLGPAYVVIAASAGIVFYFWRTTGESVHSGE